MSADPGQLRVRVVDDETHLLLIALGDLLKGRLEKIDGQIKELGEKLDEKAPLEGSIEIVGEIDGLPATLTGLYHI